jgi:hypothetical protein
MAKIIDSGICGRFVALLAIALLVLEPALPLGAQEAATPPKSLQIVILDDEAPLNNISERTAREPIVQVQDENHKPVAAAAVLFAIHPAAGSAASASFANGASTLSVVTNANGVARASGLVMNQFKGTWQLQITASKDGVTTSTTVNETNVAPDTTPGNPSPNKPPTHLFGGHGLAVIGGIAVVGVIISIVVIKANESHSTSITTGGGTVGPPAAGFKVHF